LLARRSRSGSTRDLLSPSIGSTLQSGGDSSSSPTHAHAHGEKKEDACFCIARLIYQSRFCLVLAWLAITVVSAPFAWALVLRMAPMTKTPPPGTESSAAMALFESHFSGLAILRKEMVVISCKQTPPCTSADTVMAHGLVQRLQDMVKRFDVDNPDTVVQIDTYFEFSSHHQIGNAKRLFMSQDGKSILMQWVWRVPPKMRGKAEAFCTEVNSEIAFYNAYSGEDGLQAAATGIVFLDHAMKETLIEEIPVHEIATIWLPFLILAAALRSGRMLLLALIPMPIEICTAFGFMYFVSLSTPVVMFAVMMMLMLMISLSFDYALFTLTRYAEERSAGADVEQAILAVISQSGRVVVLSGVVLIISWGAMLGLPVPFSGFSVAAGSMILVCVVVQLTFTPSLLAILPFLGAPKAERPAGAGDSADDVDALEQPRADPARLLDEPMEKAKPHMQGAYFWLGSHLTRMPWNLALPILVFYVMSPLTVRMGSNFDLYKFRFKMGHSYQLTMPRIANEWHTMLMIQREFPTVSGNLMPMMIMMTGHSNNATYQSPVDGQALDVATQSAFDANCQMADALIAATKDKPWAIEESSMTSATFHGSDDTTGKVKCIHVWQLDLLRKNWFSEHLFLSHTSKHAQQLWDQLISAHKHAMLTFVFPKLDPFSPGAFSLVTDVRAALDKETEILRRTFPGITFLTFSPGSVLLDLIDVTSGKLPVCFVICALVCLLLIAFWFGSALIPFKLVLTVVVPITWTYGAGLYVYEDGCLNFLNFPGLATTGDAGIDWTVPMFTLTFMMGLALDYEIFLFERVREFREEGFGDRESIQLGLAATGGTISSAGLIMALTFMAQLLGSMPVTNQIGFILVFSIVVDTFVVRSILVPAMLSLAPWANYWPCQMPPVCYTWLPGSTTSPQVKRSKYAKYEDEEDDDDDE